MCFASFVFRFIEQFKFWLLKRNILFLKQVSAINSFKKFASLRFVFFFSVYVVTIYIKCVFVVFINSWLVYSSYNPIFRYLLLGPNRNKADLLLRVEWISITKLPHIVLVRDKYFFFNQAPLIMLHENLKKVNKKEETL